MKNDIDNDPFDTKSAPREITDSIQEIKGYYKKKLASEIRIENPAGGWKECGRKTEHRLGRKLAEQNKESFLNLPTNGRNNPDNINFINKVRISDISNPRKARSSSGISGSVLGGVIRKKTVGNIAFTAYLENDINHMGLSQSVKFNRVLLNDGNRYNVHTGVFTAPVNGVYLFSLQMLSYARKTELRLVVDDIHQVDIATSHPAGQEFYMHSGNIAVIRVQAGQSVWVETFSTPDGQVNSAPGYRETTFAGFLLYPD